MGIYRLLIVSLLLLASSSAQQKDLYKIEGVVVDSFTGKPLPRALVQIGGYGNVALSGPEGGFSFEGLSPGHVTAAVNKPGYFGAGRGSDGAARVDIKVGPDTGKIVLKLAPEAIVTGRVTGPDEEPVEGATVQALAHRFMNGARRQLMVVSTAMTDDDGNFRLAGLRTGLYYVVAHGGTAHGVLGMQTAKSTQSYSPAVYYPGTADLAAAAVLDLTPGQRIETDFSLTLLPAYRLAGTLAAPAEWKRVNPPGILDALGQPLFPANRFDPQSGAFEFRAIPAGSYTILLSGTDSHDLAQVSERQITVAKSVTDLKLTLSPGANIPVMVRNESSKPRPTGSCTTTLPNGQVRRSDCSDHPAAQVTLLSANSAFRQFATANGPAPDPSALRIQGVTAGKYIVRAQPTVGGYVQSVRCGAQDLMQEELTVGEAAGVNPIEVVVRDDPATLRVVVDADPTEQQTVVVAIRDGVLSAISSPIINTGNGIRSMTVAPGTYKVFAFDFYENIDFADPEALARYTSQAASVTVSANENGSVVVNVIHIGE